MAIDVGTRARLVQPTIEGTVADVRYNKDAKELEYLLSYKDSAGEDHERWFNESQLAVLTDAEEK